MSLTIRSFGRVVQLKIVNVNTIDIVIDYQDLLDMSEDNIVIKSYKDGQINVKMTKDAMKLVKRGEIN